MLPMIRTRRFSLLTRSQVAQSDGLVGDNGPRTPSSATGDTRGTGRRAYYRQVARWIADVAEALHHAHLRGMVHRDVKPSNLMLCLDGRMMVLDFGMVKTVGDRSVTTTGASLR